MAETLLESSALSAFFGGVATMISAGIQTDEAVHMLAESQDSSNFHRVCGTVYQELIDGASLSDAMDASGAFPAYAVQLVRAGEESGRTEQVLHSLDLYYDEESHSFLKLRNSVSYPAALLCIMSVILLVTDIVILPIFTGVYNNLAGSLTSGSFGAVGISAIIGWIALVVTLVVTVIVVVLSLMSRTEGGRDRVIALFERRNFSKQAMYQLALARFTMALATYLSSGMDTETAMQSSASTVTNPLLRPKVEAALAQMLDMENPKSMAQAIADNEIFEPIYARMLLVGSETGGSDETLNRLSQVFFDDSLEQIDQMINRVEPLLAAFLTITVGATLVAVMLPLIGIMRSIG